MDGSTLATKDLDYSKSSTIRIWRMPQLEPIAVLKQTQHMHCFKLSDDGRLLAGITGPGDVGVWKIPSMQGPPMWHGIAALQSVSACAFSPDNRWLAASTPDGNLLIWNLETHDRRVLPRALTHYTSLSFSPDGLRLAAGSEAEGKLFDVITGQTILSLGEHGLKLAFARDGEKLIKVHKEGASVLFAPRLERIQSDWLNESPMQVAPPYAGPDPEYTRPGSHDNPRKTQ